MSDLAARFLAAIRVADRRAAFRLLDSAMDDGMKLDAIYIGVVQPALREVGLLWQRNEMTVAEEHAATAIAQTAISRLFERTHLWRDERTPVVVAGCAGLEQHHIGLKMLCDLLELDGWEAHFLGPVVPIEDFVSYVVSHRPAAIALSATIAPHVPVLRDAITAIRATPEGARVQIGVGGRAFLADPDLATRVGADFTAPDAMLAVKVFNARVRRGGA